MSIIDAMSRRHDTIGRPIAILILAGLTGLAPGCDKNDPAGGAGTAPSPEAGVATPAATSDASPAAAEPASIGPNIKFAALVHDFGDITDYKKVPCTFSFTNEGDETLIISDIKTSCGCTKVQLETKEFAPGEGTTFEVVYSPSGADGPQRKSIKIISNSVDDPVANLEIVADVKPLVEVDPSQVYFNNVLEGYEHVKTIAVRSRDPNMQVGAVFTMDKHLKVQTINDGQATGPSIPGSDDNGGWKLLEIILPATAPWGEHNAIVKIGVSGELDTPGEVIAHETPVHVHYTVFREIHPDNTWFRVGIVKPGDSFSVRVRFTRPSGMPFKILSADIFGCALPGVQTKIEEVPNAGPPTWDVYLFGDSATYRGSVSGKVRIRTDVPGDETIDIRIAGHVGTREDILNRAGRPSTPPLITRPSAPPPAGGRTAPSPGGGL
jgi:hypothetical protein